MMHGNTYLQILARMSPLPVANKSPIGLGATEITKKMKKSTKVFHRAG